MLKTPELSALILIGGKSRRMGQDKAFITYHHLPQVTYLILMLESLKISTYVSCRAEQISKMTGITSLLTDRFLDFGPLGGILTALSRYPERAWLVLACDLPLITSEHISELCKARDPSKMATAYYNLESKRFEPLFAIYEPRIYPRMLKALGDGITCPQKILLQLQQSQEEQHSKTVNEVKILHLPHQSFLQNINTPEEKIQYESEHSLLR